MSRDSPMLPDAPPPGPKVTLTPPLALFCLLWYVSVSCGLVMVRLRPTSTTIFSPPACAPYSVASRPERMVRLSDAVTLVLTCVTESPLALPLPRCAEAKTEMPVCSPSDRPMPALKPLLLLVLS